MAVNTVLNKILHLIFFQYYLGVRMMAESIAVETAELNVCGASRKRRRIAAADAV